MKLAVVLVALTVAVLLAADGAASKSVAPLHDMARARYFMPSARMARSFDQQASAVASRPHAPYESRERRPDKGEPDWMLFQNF